MSRFSRRVPTYQDAFPSSDASFVHPADVSEDVQLTHPFLAPGARMQEVQRERVIGSLGVAQAIFPTVPDNRYWYVPFWDIRHDDPVIRNVQWILEEPQAIQQVVIEATFLLSGVTANDDVSLSRTILIPPGWRAIAATETIAAGQFVTSNLMRIEYPLSEHPPPY